MKLYAGNLSYTTTEDSLREAFSNYGTVVSVTIMMNKVTGQSKGFGFIEMETDIMGERAIGGMNGKDVDGRRIRVSEAVEKPKQEGGARSFIKKNSDRNDRRERRPYGEKRSYGERKPRAFDDSGRERFRKDERKERRSEEY